MLSLVASKSTNTLAVISLVAGIFSWFGAPVIASLVAIVAGHMARSQLAARSHEEGSGLALGGLILGYSSLLIGCVTVGFVIFVYLGLLGAAVAVPQMM